MRNYSRDLNDEQKIQLGIWRYVIHYGKKNILDWCEYENWCLSSKVFPDFSSKLVSHYLHKYLYIFQRSNISLILVIATLLMFSIANLLSPFKVILSYNLVET